MNRNQKTRKQNRRAQIVLKEFCRTKGDRGGGSRGLFTVILATLVTLLGLSACSTTHISSGNSYDAKKGGQNLSEDSYFNQLSQQDPAFEGGASAPDSNGNSAIGSNGQVIEAADNCPPCAAGPGSGLLAGAPSASGEGEEFFSPQDEEQFKETGLASWYGPNFEGKQTASGELFDSRKLTAAHKEIPFGSIILVRNLENDREILVKVNDRGPFVKNRILDVSEYGAELLGYKQQGLVRVGIRLVREGKAKQVSGRRAAAENSENYSNKGAEGRGEGREEDISPTLEKLSSRKYDFSAIPTEGIREFYSVQLGIFIDLKNARGLESYLKGYGQPVQIRKRGNLYVVRMGRFTNRYGAERLVVRLAADGYSSFVSEPD